MSPRLLVVGSANVDLFAHVPRHPRPGETLIGRGGDRAGGGKGANQALAAALQGADVSFVGAVGDDGDAAVALEALREAGVDLDGVATADAPTGFAVITVAEGGENTIVVVPGANASVTADQAREAVEGLGEGGILLMQGELPRETTEASVRAARSAGHRVVLNVAPWMELDQDVLTAADPLVLNEHEAEQAVEELGLEPAADSPPGLARALREAGTPSVVITLGADGAVLDSPAGALEVPCPQVDTVDTTGAGDAFTGALAAYLLAGQDLEDAVHHAVRVGAYAVQRAGAQPSYPRGGEDLPA